MQGRERLYGAPMDPAETKVTEEWTEEEKTFGLFIVACNMWINER